MTEVRATELAKREAQLPIIRVEIRFGAGQVEVNKSKES